MVQSTGVANAQYLRGLVLGEGGENRREDSRELDGQRRWLASSRWAAAAQFAIAVSLTSSQNDLQRLEFEDQDSILFKTKDAVITLRGVLEGKHDKLIEESLDQYQISRDGWWSSLYRMVEGTVVTSVALPHPHLLRNRTIKCSRSFSLSIGLAVMSRLSRNRLHQSEFGLEDRSIDWDRADM